MNTRTWITMSVLGAAAAAGLCWSSAPDTAAEPVTARGPASGEVLVYALSYTGSSSMTMPDGSEMTASLEIAGELELAGAGDLVQATFTDVDTAELVMGGAALAPSLGGQTVTVSLDPHGEITAFYFAPGTPVLTRQLMQSILLDGQVIDGGGDAWTETQQDTNGALVGQWARDGGDIVRASGAYASLKGFADAALDGHTAEGQLRASLRKDGTLDTLEASTRLHMPARGEIRSELRQRRIGTRRASGQVASTAGLEAAAPDATPGAELAAENALRGRVGDLTWGDLADALLDGSAIADADLAWQATGLLKLRPELAAELARLHADGDLTADGRDLIVDLLANAGNPASQQALCGILERPDVQAGGNYGRTVQAVVFVSEPTEETVAFLGELGAQQDGPQSRMTLNAAAIAASRRAEQGDSAAARALAGETAARLAAAESPTEQASLLLTMGNLKRPEQLDTIMAYTDASDAEVRAASARALRAIDDPDARAELVRLAGDDDRYVQIQALRSMDPSAMSDGDFHALVDQINAGAVQPGAEEWFVRIASGDPRGGAVLAALLEQGVDSATLQGQIESAL